MVGAHSTRSRAGRVAVALALGALAHVALDAIPHSDYAPLPLSRIVWVALAEILTSCAVIAYVLRHRLMPRWPEYLIAGIGASAAPDAKFVARLLLPSNVAARVAEYGDRLHVPFHAAPPSSPRAGWMAEIVCVAILLALLTRFPRSDSAPAAR